ncbi:phosphatase PAP2 family protein [uncultured Flavonifractor sp.]|uniref:phosphatase PAP2 family protein n=1 Tax=uncultured Flavonifractor sp. TaxID=1193534 RepID=UPI00263199A5|nr:phosphatase PAP2 family protein [uncultured Flavonifractor sp.]
MPQWLLNMDGGILLWLQDVVRNGILDPFFKVYTQLGNAGLLWIVLSLVLLCIPKTRKAGFVSLIAMLLGLLCTNVVLKHLVGRERPWLLLTELVPLVAEHDPNSFPSGHTCAAFAAASAWCRTLPRRWMKVVAVVMAALMGFSRLYVGVHFPTDVVAGMAVGLLCGWLAWLIWKRLAAWRGWEA